MGESTSSALEKNWPGINDQRGQIADAVNRLIEHTPRHDHPALTYIRSYFSGTQGWEVATQRPDVLAICLQVMRIPHDKRDSTAATDRAVRMGFFRLGPSLDSRGRWLKFIGFPLVMLLVMATILVFVSQIIIPFFQYFIQDFEIQAPFLTEFVFEVAWLIRAVWPAALIGFIALVAFTLVMNGLTRSARRPGESWIDWRFKSRRGRAATWAWHVGMLLEAGLSISESARIASESQGGRWSPFRRKGQTSPDPDSESGSPLVTELGPVDQRYAMIGTTLKLTDDAARSDLLRETAIYYWNRNRTIGDWWSRWLASLLFWMFLFVVSAAIIAIYSPVMAIFSGMGYF